MASPFIVDFEKAIRGQELNETIINIKCWNGSSLKQVPMDGCEEGSVFRDHTLPEMCASRSMTDDVVASYQAEYDRLEYGEVFSFWLFSASGFDAEMNSDFNGVISQVKHEKVEKFRPSDRHGTHFHLCGNFRRKGPNQYERIAKRILGESGFNYVRRWNSLENLFQKEEIRTEPLTVDEIDCLLEYEKYKMLKNIARGTPIETIDIE
eukprot:GEMP01087278.1.p1 GENE.GEMP01087278.1~~GEMP01087278.1.p1  ORF type:complete len:208 (+),score=29.23 GEMP01087278.1:86-709(+)